MFLRNLFGDDKKVSKYLVTWLTLMQTTSIETMSTTMLSPIALLLFSLFPCNAFIILDDITGNPKVNLSGGEIEGRLLETGLGAKAYVFQGIPYTEPPVGNLRFSKPVTKKPWNGTIQCQEYKAACYQNVTISTYDLMSEDCLFMNVFAGLQCTNESLCPVLYYIHGGAWEFESPSMFPAEVLVENFASQGIVLALVAYRLGVAGYWSTGTEDAIGNWAMEDMVEGAKWVQREIHNFGGDKTKVTVMGHSSSAQDVSLLTISKRTEGLFHQAVFMSGNSGEELYNDVSTYQDLAISLECASKLDWRMKSQYRKIIRCMRTIPIDVLVNKFNEIRGCTNCSFPPNPLARPRNDGSFGLFPKPLDEMKTERRAIRTLTGTTKNEMGTSKLNFINATAQTVRQACSLVVRSKGFSQTRKIIQECRRQYVTNVDPHLYDNATFPYWTEQVTTLAEDVGYFAPCFKDCSTLRSAGSEVYLYSFDYEKQGLEGVAPWHAQDLTYVMGSHMFPFDSRDYEIRSRYLPLFVNFVKFGNPTPEPMDNVTWMPLKKPYGFNYLSVDIPVSLQPDYHKSGVIFWNYKVPLIENQYTFNPRNYDWISKKDQLKQHIDYNDSSSPNWRNAFWTVFILLVAVLSAIIGVSVYTYQKRKHVRNRHSENQRLLLSFNELDNYNSC